MAMGFGDIWAQLGSLTATCMFVYAIIQKYFPHHLRDTLDRYTKKLTNLVSPYIRITFHEFTGEYLRRCEAYSSIQTYLNQNCSTKANCLKAETIEGSKSPLLLSLANNEEITDEFKGVKVWWASKRSTIKEQSFPLYGQAAYQEKRYYMLTFHKRYREVIIGSYLNHVLEQGKEISARNRQLMLYTNKGSNWKHVVFEHPASFQTLALEEEKKEEILKDLATFSKGKEYYAKIGKAWKRGYLLYGPPGTGKSTMVAAMANYLNYDVYDLELTTVKDNSELRSLLLGILRKSIVVIEDIDCSVDFTGQRRKRKEKGEGEKENKDSINKKDELEEKKGSNMVTLSGLLNCIDGLWSACGGERVVVFTTNFVDKLDPALIRRGRMDMHIQLSYCCYEAFKVLARNYLDIESHPLFHRIGDLLKQTNMTPADVGENLMPKTDEDGETCLKRLIEALEISKEEAEIKAEEETK